VGGDWVVNKATKQAVALPGQYSLGDPNPKFNMSFINNLNYKNIVSFNMQWDWVSGAHLYNQTKQWMYRDGIHHDYDNPICDEPYDLVAIGAGVSGLISVIIGAWLGKK
jgi:hypothetical protein